MVEAILVGILGSVAAALVHELLDVWRRRSMA